MHTSAEAVDHFLERNQVESIEESINVASWSRASRFRLILKGIKMRLHL